MKDARASQARQATPDDHRLDTLSRARDGRADEEESSVSGDLPAQVTDVEEFADKGNGGGAYGDVAEGDPGQEREVAEGLVDGCLDVGDAAYVIS